MKKIFLSLLCVLLLFTACKRTESVPVREVESTTETEESESVKDFVGLWLTYSELSVKGKNYTEKSYKDYIGSLFQKAANKGVTDVFVHARPFADALYFSSFFPQSEYSCGKRGGQADFDILSLCVSEGRKHNLRIHAWINPYRVSASFSEDCLCEGKIKQWYAEKTEDVFESGGGLYLSPSSENVKALIISCVKEIMENYDVAGIHFDDYFYPENCGESDRAAYKSYTENGGKLSIENYRRENVNSLISSVYLTVKSFGEDKVFSISPSGSINKNYSELYADVALWCKGGFCDMIIPQLYYGFHNETMPFEKTLDEWRKLCENSAVSLVPGLALYKCSAEDEFAGSGKYEWQENPDVIYEQIEMLKEKGIIGYSLFSASYLEFLTKNLRHG